MDSNTTAIVCDGCGLPASPEHIAARMERLELVTRFRPIHIHVLFVALEPMPRPEDDFYRPPESRDFFDSFLSALDISSDEGNDSGGCGAKLLEFQRRGYYLTYLSECPVTPRLAVSPGRERPLPGASSAWFPAEIGAREEGDESAMRQYVSRLAHTLVKRIRFNYKPKHVALLGSDMGPLIQVFEDIGLGPLLLLDQGAPLIIPRPGDAPSLKLFRRTVKIETLCGTTSSGTSGV